MRSKFIFLMFILGFLPFSKAQDSVDFTQFELQNGLDVILHEDHSAPIVAITVTYHVGSKNEDPNRTGFAHFFEHLMFEGTKHIERGKYGKLVQNAGGKMNASTSFDLTQYFEVLPSNQLKFGVWLESERMLHAKIDSQGVETQREVIKQEKKQRFDNQPYGSILKEIFSHSYEKHPYRWVPIGEEQYIDKAKVSEFREFYETFYVPNNAVLSLAGDFDTDNAKKLVKKYFSGIPEGQKAIPRPDVKEPEQTEETRDTVYDNIQIPAVIQSYHIPAVGKADYYALDMITTLLSDGKSSRLYESLVDEKAYALNVSASTLSLEDPGLFFIFAISNQGISPDTLEMGINKEIKKVRNNLITNKEFRKLKNQIENDFYSRRNSVRNKATLLARYHTLYGNTNLINTEIQRYMDVTKKDLKRVANEYLVPENRTVLYYLPKSEKVEQ